ncbi:uncharacterized protein NECHADRAFT_105757 [Fusarium vanettenii 77-13-4]|uniref:Amino acid permease/ SLC12A domain-containing protein n=1 Tax=Fusarium vanettenii (strain ATCC MYA-4622 / CBS 123669 / FGSC 9596 / NRRL 45880 / 77-13-4) TaxID=660122 RepID=C7ZQ83_FUSV7|nr:uncharacterized protein NECHADRAFT_105757 [Fusarium vanettenii 77-13-4]EEU33812.1 hypothetical protein NECHADRAFT_105757 [Fusarium vanettenii 77-13-4]
MKALSDVESKAAGHDTGCQQAHDWGHTKRGLAPRHVQLMAIGGAIGTGLFVGIGSVLQTAGPLSLLLGFVFWSIFFIWPLNLCVAEMSAYLPVRGTIFELASRVIDPAFGFAMGWAYFYASVMLVCTEYSAVATIIQYWNTSINPAVWIVIAMAFCVIVNVFGVKYYGETEVIASFTKILLLVGNGNAIHPYYTTGSTGNFLGWWAVVIYAVFSIAGPDMIALSSGEIQNPRRTVPRVAKLIFYRIVGFYVIGVLAVGIICDSTDEKLLSAQSSNAPGVGASPWVIGIQNLGIAGLPDLINALVLLSGWSCGNAYVYTSTRTLDISKHGHAPKFLERCTRSGVPIHSVVVVTVLSCLTFLTVSNSTSTVFFWFVGLTTAGIITVYTGMIVVFIGWHRACKAQGLPGDSLPYRAPLSPWIAYWVLGFGLVTILFLGWDAFRPFSAEKFVTSYFCPVYFCCLFIFWKIFKRTKLVRPLEADLVTGKKEIDDECAIWEEGGLEENYRRRLSEMSFIQRCWERLW